VVEELERHGGGLTDRTPIRYALTFGRHAPRVRSGLATGLFAGELPPPYGKASMRKYLLGLLAVALTFAALLAPGAPAASNPVVSSATGSGHMVRPDGTFRSFSFSARKYADGTVNGELQLNSRGFDVFVHIKIDCLRLNGSIAYMSGLITHSSNPAEGVVGELNRWAVQDNGEGSGADPDMVSSIPENEGNLDPKTCEDDNSDRPISRIVQRGNVQVRGG
jgi:hypothetical protein